MRSNLAKEEGVQGEEKTGLGGCRCLLKGRNRAGIRGRGVEQWGGGWGSLGQRHVVRRWGRVLVRPTGSGRRAYRWCTVGAKASAGDADMWARVPQ
jgi:hypothetical protein